MADHGCWRAGIYRLRRGTNGLLGAAARVAGEEIDSRSAVAEIARRYREFADTLKNVHERNQCVKRGGLHGQLSVKLAPSILAADFGRLGGPWWRKR